MPRLIDATVISNFAAIGRLELLRRHLGMSFLAVAVYDELRGGADLDFPHLAQIDAEVLDLSEGGWLRLVSPANAAERAAFDMLAATLDPGEAMWLAIAGERGWLFLTDDLRARQAAQQRGMLISGTVGVLIGLVRAGTLTLDEGNVLLT